MSDLFVTALVAGVAGFTVSFVISFLLSYFRMRRDE